MTRSTDYQLLEWFGIRTSSLPGRPVNRVLRSKFETTNPFERIECFFECMPAYIFLARKIFYRHLEGFFRLEVRTNPICSSKTCFPTDRPRRSASLVKLGHYANRSF